MSTVHLKCGMLFEGSLFEMGLKENQKENRYPFRGSLYVDPYVVGVCNDALSTPAKLQNSRWELVHE